ncbi:MAG: TrbG/VirB9 family P-type conjugative transfer protein [Alphaproteobacteria bacterium]|nr:TrbG/VirB9 family P-type conjugative transfer protein [Rickettsiales bacterium]
MLLKQISLLTVLTLTLFANSSFAKVVAPQPYGTEPRFRSWTYYPNTVFRHVGYYTRPTYIEFEEGETVNGISLPKPNYWDFVPNGNRLYLKPISDNADTTVTITTNKRTYFFEMQAREPNGPFDPNVLFFVKFRYPQSSSKGGSAKDGEEENTIYEFNAIPLPDLSRPEQFNFNYTISGDSVISPIAVFDNGIFTYMKFEDTVPAVFTVDPDGFEGIVNFRMVGDYMIVERVGPIFTLRNGFATVCVFNENMMQENETRAFKKKLKTKQKK